jgi:hypothetical protein
MEAAGVVVAVLLLGMVLQQQQVAAYRGVKQSTIETWALCPCMYVLSSSAGSACCILVVSATRASVIYLQHVKGRAYAAE